MTKLEKLEAEIKKLSPSEINQLSDWMAALRNDLWDAQIAQDAQSGKLDSLIGVAKKDIAAGRVKPLWLCTALQPAYAIMVTVLL